MFANILLWLERLHNAFSRRKTHQWFCMFILALILQKKPRGTVQSYINTLDMHQKYYSNLDDMFRSNAVDLQKLTDQWFSIIETECTPKRFRGRRVFVSDGVKKPKEGRRMPGVTRQHNDSDTQSKPSSFHGIQAGGISMLVEHPLNPAETLSMPIELRILDGLDPVSQWPGTSHPFADEPLEMQSFHRLERYVQKSEDDVYLVADRASMSQKLFLECKNISERTGRKVHLITNAKCNAVGFKKPVYSGIGRPPKKGDRVELAKLFSEKISEFTCKRLFIYGKHQTVRYYTITLLWGLKLLIPIKFVLCCMEDGRKIILATNDLDLPPVDVIRLYSQRFGSIEEDFKVLKNEFCGMSYRFWTLSMPHLSHFRSKDAPHILEEVTDEHDRKLVLDAIRASELYMQSAFIAQGIVKLLAAKQPVGGIIQKFTQKRTYTERKVSETDVCSFLCAYKDAILRKYGSHPIIRFLTKRRIEDQVLEDVI